MINTSDVSQVSQYYNFRTDTSILTGTADEVDESILDEVVDSEAVELTPEEEFELFKETLYQEISDIYKDAPSNLLAVSVNISDEALEKMQTDDEFKQEMLDSMKSDAEGLEGLSYSAYMSVSIDEDGYSRSETSVNSTDSTLLKNAKANLFKAEASGSFLYEELNDIDSVSSLDAYLNQLLSGTSSLSQDDKQKELLAMISEQKDFIQQFQEHKALQSSATTTSSILSQGFLA